MKYKFLQLISELIHYNELDKENVFRFFIDAYNYKKTKMKTASINDRALKVLEQEEIDFKEILNYMLNHECIEFLHLDEINEIMNILNIKEPSTQDTCYEIKCGLWHTDFAEDLIKEIRIITFDCIKNKAFYSNETFKVTIKHDEERYYRHIESFDSKNAMKPLYLYYLPESNHFILNICDKSKINKAIPLGKVYSEDKADDFELILKILKNKQNLKVEI